MNVSVRDFLHPVDAARRAAHRVSRFRLRRLFAQHRDRIREFHNLHAGGRCFIIGNGPSLNVMDLTPLRDEVTFGVNAIYLNYEKMGFRPTYYAVEDIFVAEDRADEINRLDAPVKFFPQDLCYCLRPRPGVIYIRFNRRLDIFPSFSYDASEVVYWGSTVTYLNMQLAYYMGFQTACLIGMDHNYTIPSYAKGMNITSREDDPNHFRPDYFGKGRRWHNPRPDRVEAAFRLARKEFEAAGRQIVNATAGGKLELFPRRDYKEVICSTS